MCGRTEAGERTLARRTVVRSMHTPRGITQFEQLACQARPRHTSRDPLRHSRDGEIGTTCEPADLDRLIEALMEPGDGRLEVGRPTQYAECPPRPPFRLNRQAAFAEAERIKDLTTSPGRSP